MVGRQSLYLWDNATYYNLQVRLESNFADGVFTGVGSTIYKTWFNDYAPLVINLLASRSSCSRRARPTRLRCSVRC